MEGILINILSQFNNREYAILVWVVIFLIWGLFNKDIRKSIFRFLSSKDLIQLIFPVITYNLIVIYLLFISWFWSIDFFKDSLYWIFWSSLVLFFRIVDVDKGAKFIFKTIFSAFSVTAMLAFVWNIYPFSFFSELILQFVLIFLGMMSGIWKLYTNNPEYTKVAKFFEIILLWLVIFLIVRLLVLLVYDYEQLFDVQNLYFFLYPIILSVLYIPFLYLLRLMMNYESLFIRINPVNWWWERNARHIKYGIAKFCHFNLHKLNKFSDFFGRNYFLQDKPDIEDLILKFNKQS